MLLWALAVLKVLPPEQLLVGLLRGLLLSNRKLEAASPQVEQYVRDKLIYAGFGDDYNVILIDCACLIDTAQYNTPQYTCQLFVTIKNPDIGSPGVVAEYLAGDIDATGPFACSDEMQPFCGVPPEGITSACAVFPSEPVHFCWMEEPPDPLPVPIVWPDEADNCDPNYNMTEAQQQSLIDYAYTLTSRLYALTFANFTCADALGNAYYQATIVISAGIDIDIYTASDNLVLGINAQQNTLCTKPDRPFFCKDPPLGGSMICSINQYDPKKVYQCPNAAAQLAVSFGNPDCSCRRNPNTPAYQRNVLVFVSNLIASEGLSMIPSVPDGACVQNDTDCQYVYRARIQPFPDDDTADTAAAIQVLETDINNTPQPCYPPDSSLGWPFCSYWPYSTNCGVAPWNRNYTLQCDIIPVDPGYEGD
eukprot:gene12311-12447_t